MLCSFDSCRAVASATSIPKVGTPSETPTAAIVEAFFACSRSRVMLPAGELAVQPVVWKIDRVPSLCSAQNAAPARSPTTTSTTTNTLSQPPPFGARTGVAWVVWAVRGTSLPRPRRVSPLPYAIEERSRSESCHGTALVLEHDAELRQPAAR